MFFWNPLAFSMIQKMLAIWSLVPLPFLKPAWTSGSSQFTYCWSLAWRILSIILLACEMSAINGSVLCYFGEMSLKGGICSLPFHPSAGRNGDVIARAQADILDHSIEVMHWGHCDSKIEGCWVPHDLWNFPTGPRMTPRNLQNIRNKVSKSFLFEVFLFSAEFNPNHYKW